jgi:hypothetical protein
MLLDNGVLANDIAERIGDAIADNFIVIFFAIVVVIVLVIALRYMDSRQNVKMAGVMLDMQKLQLMSKRMLVSDLRESAIVLNDGERSKLDSIGADNAILARRNLATMSEVEERMKRLERSVDLAKLEKTLADIRKQEGKLLG